MSEKHERKYLAVAIGTAFAASMTFAGSAAADANPFQVAELDSGYLQVAMSHGGEKDAEGKCGEGKCGGDKAAEKDAEGKCGEGKCGGDKAKHKHKHKDKDAEGKCGEGKCGGDK